MIDGFGRNIDYLRISLTDKCNLRCKYCMPKEGIQHIPHEEMLTLEEIYRVSKVMCELGIKKIRLTGGEPLVRKNIVKLISDINGISGIEDIAITTNGILLLDMIESLKNAGLRRVNLSLDTLDEGVFENITRSRGLSNVVSSIDKCLSLGIKLKINCVPCRQFNENEIERIAYLAKDKNIDVRFIELMPIGCGKEYDGIDSGEILSRLEKTYGKATIVNIYGNGPANYYKFDGFAGNIGLISPLTHKFCSECNRVRLTSEGVLKLCLHHKDGVSLKKYIREEKYSDEELKNIIIDSINKKPKSHNFENKNTNGDTRKMYQIGG